MADRPTPKPQNEATLAAFSGGVVIQTDDGHWIALSPKLARKLAEELPEMAHAAETVAEHNQMGYYPSVLSLKPGTGKPL